ncbi:hypothetical protein DFJ63DRAFT_311904 [Scheffersomyces coipomensis]|uniref:uncharacterized protein n=1 Tax=Scheffersomyces coipomensis TaxID=1788519 RepID=UPI00315D37A3
MTHSHHNHHGHHGHKQQHNTQQFKKPVVYRPARIQTINAEQEIILKQVWANMLKYYDYPIDISNEDLQYGECFIPSTSTVGFEDKSSFHELTRTTTRNSVNSSSSKKTSRSSRGLFGGKKETKETILSAPVDSKRMHQIQTQSSFEKYRPVTEVNPKFEAVFRGYYKAGMVVKDQESDDYYEDEDDGYTSDLSLETFVTASTTITDFDGIIPTYNKSKSSSHQNNGYGGNSGHNSYSIANIKPNTSLLPFMAQYKAKNLHNGLYTALRNDLPDNFILRFVRARKWKYDNALQMMFKSLAWRTSGDFDPDNWVYEADGKSYLTGTNKGFIKNFSCEKSYIKGHDNNRNPIFMFQAKKHFGSDSPLNESQRYAVVTIEWCRLFLREVTDSVDQCSIVFDLTGFSLKNADYATIKFLADVFEAHYPETLGVILIHNAPWIFSTVWNIIKNWLDPVVASKIHFTKDAKELSKFVDPIYIPDYLGGEDDTKPFYPIPEEQDMYPPKRKDATYKKLIKERDDLYLKFLETTKRWVESTNPSISDQYLKDKIKLNIALSDNYLNLDPYIRCQGIYDRDGTLHPSN